MKLQLFSLPIADLPRVLLVHAAIMVLSFGTAAVVVWRWPGVWLALRDTGRALARQHAISLLLICSTAWLLSGLAVVVGGVPRPTLHDEFSNLLAADTFASGRITNPTPPLWEHFETIHVLSRPTYQSKYPAGQGLLLAAGQVLSGQPYLGVWLATGLLSGAVYWMLLAWLPERWALFGGWLTALHAGITLHWGTCYSGGQLAVIGGALLYGGLGRLGRASILAVGMVMGVGLAILANSRPAEGFLVSLPAVVLLARWSLHQGGGLRSAVSPWLAMAVPLVPCALLMGYYNWRVTGDSLTLPYQEHTRQYMAAPIFFWESVPQTPQYNHDEIRKFYAGWELRQYQQQTTPAGYVKGRLKRFLWIVLFFTPPALMLAWLGVPGALADPQVRRAAAILASVALPLLAWVWLWPHYLAPCASLIVLLVAAGFRRMYRWRIGRRAVGRWLVAGAVLSQGAVALYIACVPAKGSVSGWNAERARILTELQARPGKHLVLVAYQPNHHLHHEWVFNAADIDGAKVIWARMMDGPSNQTLLNYFRDRHVWYLEADQQRPEVVHLDESLRLRVCARPAASLTSLSAD